MKKNLLTVVVAALITYEVAADSVFEQAAIKNEHGEVANGLLFSQSRRCFVLTVEHITKGSLFEIWSEREYGRAELLRALPKADLGLLEVASDYRFLCSGDELPQALPTSIPDGDELASADLFLHQILTRGPPHREEIELKSFSDESLLVVAPGPAGRVIEGWSGSVLWQHRPGGEHRPLAIVRRLPTPQDAGEVEAASPSAASDRPPLLSLLRIDRALELVEPYLPGSGATELARRRYQPELKPGARELTFWHVFRSNPKIKLLISVDRGDWTSVRHRFPLPSNARTFRLKLDPNSGPIEGLPGKPFEYKPFEYSVRQVMLDTMLESAKVRYRYFDCAGSHCTFEASGVLPVVRTVHMGTDRSSLDQVFQPSMPLEEFLEYPHLRVNRELPRPLCAGPLFYQVELVDGVRTPILSVPHRRAEMDCPPESMAFEDPGVLSSADPDAVLAYATFETNLFENRIELDTYLGLEVEAITYAYGSGQATQVTRTLGSFHMPADLEADTLNLELHLRNGQKLGPFSYEIDLFTLKKLRALLKFDKRRFLRCFHTTPSRSSAFGKYVEGPATVCFAELGNDSNEAWIAADLVEMGTAPNELTTSHTIDARLMDRDYRARYVVGTFPYDAEVIYARVKFFNGRWSDIRRFVVEG